MGFFDNLEESESLFNEKKKTTESNIANRGNFTRGLLSGIDTTQATLGGAIGLAGDALGVDSVRDWGFDTYKKNMDEASLNPVDIPNFSDISTDGPIEALSDTGKWFAGTVGQLAPSMAQALVTTAVGALAGGASTGPVGAAGGALTGLFGRKVAVKAIDDAVASFVAKGVAKDVAEETVKKQLASKIAGAAVGGNIGLVEGTAMLEGGGMWGDDAAKRGVENANAGSAFALSQLSGLSELVSPGGAIIKRLAGLKGASKVVDGVADKFINRLAKEVPEAMGGEFAQESFQEFLSVLNEKIQDPTVNLTDKKVISQILNAGAAGAAGGLVFGTVSAVAPESPAQIKKKAEEQTPATGDAMADAKAKVEAETRLITEEIAKREQSKQEVAKLRKIEANLTGMLSANPNNAIAAKNLANVRQTLAQMGEQGSVLSLPNGQGFELVTPEQSRTTLGNDLMDQWADDATVNQQREDQRRSKNVLSLPPGERGFEMVSKEKSDAVLGNDLLSQWTDDAVELSNRENQRGDRNKRQSLPPGQGFTLVGEGKATSAPDVSKIRGDRRIPSHLVDAITKMEYDLKNGDSSGVIVAGQGNNQTVEGGFPSTNPTWFKNDTIKKFDKQNGTDYAKSVSKLSVVRTLRKIREGRPVDTNKADSKTWQYIQAVAEQEANTDPELVANREFSNLEKEGFEFDSPKPVNVGNMREGDQVVVLDKKGMPDKLTHKGRAENGNIVLQDGVRMEVDEFDVIPDVISEKKGGVNDTVQQDTNNQSVQNFTEGIQKNTGRSSNTTEWMGGSTGIVQGVSQPTTKDGDGGETGNGGRKRAFSDKGPTGTAEDGKGNGDERAVSPSLNEEKNDTFQQNTNKKPIQGSSQTGTANDARTTAGDALSGAFADRAEAEGQNQQDVPATAKYNGIVVGEHQFIDTDGKVYWSKEAPTTKGGDQKSPVEPTGKTTVQKEGSNSSKNIFEQTATLLAKGEISQEEAELRNLEDHELKPLIQKRIDAGKDVRIGVNVDRTGMRFSAMARGVESIRLYPTKEETKLAKKLNADLELADTQEERDAAHAGLRKALLPAVLRALDGERGGDTTNSSKEGSASVQASSETPVSVPDNIGQAKRGKPKNMVVFDKPIDGKDGNKILSYDWSWTGGFKFDHNEGEIEARVSDWENAVENPETGRKIVHKFNVATPTGETKTVSLETAQKLLGTGENLLTKVKHERNREFLRSVFNVRQKLSNYIKSGNGNLRRVALDEFNSKDIKNILKNIDRFNLDRISFGEPIISDRSISILMNKHGEKLSDHIKNIEKIVGKQSSPDKESSTGTTQETPPPTASGNATADTREKVGGGSARKDWQKTKEEYAGKEPKVISPMDRSFYPDDAKAHDEWEKKVREHSLKIADALKEGKPVPKKVYSAYPGLQPNNTTAASDSSAPMGVTPINQQSIKNTEENQKTTQENSGDVVSESIKDGFIFSETDIPYQTAYDAYSGSSFSPEKRAKQEQQGYVEHMKNVIESLQKYAKTDEQKEDLKSWFNDYYKPGYLKRKLSQLAADSRTMSSMITGPSNFPVRSNQKKLDTAHKRLTEILDFDEKAQRKMKNQLRGNKAISSTDPEALTKLKEKLAGLEKNHEIMKSVNAIVRKKGLSDEQKISEIVGQGLLSEKNAQEILKPDYMGRVGFAGFNLSNNNANMKTVKERIAALENREVKAEETGGSETREFDGGSVELNHEDGFVRVYHDDKPSAEVRKELKSNGFRWSPRDVAWRRKLTRDAQYKAEKITGVDFSKVQDDISENLETKKAVDTDSPAFRKWFGDSKVVDENGEPLVVYHGTSKSFTQFSPDHDVSAFTGLPSGNKGMYFTKKSSLANQYAQDGSGLVYPVYLRIKHPYVISEKSVLSRLERVGSVFTGITSKGRRNLSRTVKSRAKESFFITEDFKNELLQKGYDGIINNVHSEIVVFFPNQIKSAISNTGKFSSTNQDISENLETTATKGEKTTSTIKEQLSLAAKSTNQTTKKLAKLLLDFIPENKLNATITIDPQAKTASYNLTKDTITLTDPANLETTLHEIVHGVTAREMEHNQKLKLRVRNLMVKTRKEVVRLGLISRENMAAIESAGGSKAFKNRFPAGTLSGVEQIAYGLLNEREFLSQAFSSKEFQDILKSIPVENRGWVKTAWDAFVEAVMRSLKIPFEQHTVFSEVLNVTAELAGVDLNSTDKENLSVGEFAQADSESLNDAKRNITENPAFRRWFGDSKVVDKNGEPLAVYHGTDVPGTFSVFEPYYKKINWFAQDPALSDTYAENRDLEGYDEDSKVYPVFLSSKKILDLSNVKDANDKGDMLAFLSDIGLSDVVDKVPQYFNKNTYVMELFQRQEVLDGIMRKGYDGIKIKENGRISFAVFKANQIKSVFNRGTFSTESDDISEELSASDLSNKRQDTKSFTKTYRDLMSDEPYVKKLPTDSTIFSKLFSSPEYTFKKAAAAWRVLQVQYNRMDEKIRLENKIFGQKTDKDGKKTGFIQIMQEAKSKFKESYKKANDYLLNTDRTGNSFTIKREAGWTVNDPQGKEIGFAETRIQGLQQVDKHYKVMKKAAFGKWVAEQKVSDPSFKAPKLDDWDFGGKLRADYKVSEIERWSVVDSKGKEVSRFDSDAEAQKDMMDREGASLADKGFDKKSIELVRSYREMTNNAFNLMIADLRNIIKTAKEQGLDEPTVSIVDESKRWRYTDKNGNHHYFTTKQDAQQAGGRSGTIREQKDGEIRKEMKLGEVIAMMSDLRGSYFARQRNRGSIVLRAEKKGVNGADDQKVMKKFDFHMVEDRYVDSETGVEYNRRPLAWMKKSFNFAMSKIPGTLAMEMNQLKRDGYTILSVGKETSMPESVFEAAKLVSSIAAMLDEAKTVAEKKGADKAAIEETNKLLTAAIAGIVQQRGYMSSRMKRNRNYWSGFEEDMLLSGTQYARGLAAGIAKKQAAKAFIEAVTGRDISWQQWKIDNPAGDYEQYLEMVEKRKLDPLKQPALYADTMNFVKEMLRNEEQVDRILGTIQGVAVLKFLGLRVSSAAVNATNMVQAVPATISSHSGGSLTDAFMEVGRAATTYGRFRLGKDISQNDRDVLLEIINNGWDEAQFNKESVSVLQSKFGRGWNTISEYSMKMFGAVEKVNRATTILAAYNQLRKNTNLTHEEMMQKAKHASDRAHGVYGKATRPVWTRGAWNPLRLAFTFAKFSQNYAMNMAEMGLRGDYKQAGYMLLSPAIIAGSGATLASPVLVALASSLGVGGDDPEEEFYKWAEDTFGTDRVARHGLAGLFGINLKGSIQMNNPMPTKISEIFGAPGAIFTDVAKGAKAIGRGEIMKGAEALLPTGIGTMVKATREATEGISTGSYSPVYYGDEAIKADGVDATLRFFGFNPSTISGIREKQWHEKQVAAKFQERRNEINTMIKRYGIYGKGDKYEIYKEIQRYNELVLGSGRSDISLINPAKQFRTIIKRAKTPGKVERLREL